MALSSAIEWDIQTGGSDSNGGGFKAGASGTDRSTSTTPQATLSVLSTVHTTTTQINVSLTDYTVQNPGDVGNVLQVTGGSATADFYEITTADTVNNRWTVDKAVGTAAQTVVGRMGGCLLTLSKVEPKAVAGNTIHVKDGTYAELLTLTISGGNGTPRTWAGYATTHGDAPTGTTRPLIDAAGARASCVAVVATAGNVFSYFRGSGGTAANFDQTTGFSEWRQCKSSGATAEGWKATTTGALVLVACESSGNTTIGVNVTGSANLVIDSCYIHDNTTTGVTAGTSAFVAKNCIIEANGSHGISIPGSVAVALIDHCTIDGNTGGTTDGINVSGAGTKPFIARNNLLTNNGKYGANRTGATAVAAFAWNYNDYNGNGTAGLNSITAGANDSTADPGYTNRGAGDFTIATTLADSGYPGAFPGATTTGFSPMGAVGRSGTASGGGMLVHPGMEGGCKGY